MSSEEPIMAKVKHCVHGVPPSPKRKDSPSPKKTEPPPPPLTSLSSLPTGLTPPPSFPNVPFSIIMKKSITSLTLSTQKLAPPLTKKISQPTPFIKGQLGHVFFSMSMPQSYMEMPHGHSIIVGSFQKPYSYKNCKSIFILIDPLGNKWTSPEVFNLWHETIESGEMEEIDQKVYQIAIVHLGNEFHLCSSLCKNSFKDHIIPVKDVHQLAEEDPHEKDPDFVPDEDNDDLN